MRRGATVEVTSRISGTGEFLLSGDLKTENAPYGRDPIEIKRYMSTVILALIPAFPAALNFSGGE